MAEGRQEAEGGSAEAAESNRSRISAFRVDVAVFALVALSLFVPIVGVGLWDPFELDVAEAARRIAVNLLGAGHLTIDGALNNVPIRRELGRGELPFTSIALGFRLFGLSDWAGRLPLALWSLLGVLSTYSLVHAFSSRRAARLAALLLAVTPLYFMHARTLSGEAVTLACTAIAVRGLAGAIWGGSPTPENGFRARALWLIVGVAGLYAGFWARGLLIGVAVPTLGVSLGWLVVTQARGARRWLGWGLLCGGLVATALGVSEVLRDADGAAYSVLLGTRVVAQGDAAFHDSVVGLLAHGAFPISVLLPFAVARLFVPPRRAGEREVTLRAILVSCLLVAFVIHGFAAPYTGPLPFCATFACAAAVACFLADLDVEQASARALGFAIVALAVLLLRDFHDRPEKAFSAFASTSSVFPTSLLSYHRLTWFFVSAGVSVVFLFVLADRRSPTAPRFDWQRDYFPYVRGLRAAYGGNLWFFLMVSYSGLALWAFLVWMSDSYLHIPEISSLWSVVRTAAYHGWWVFPLATVALPLMVIAVADMFRSLLLPGFGWLSQPSLRRLQLTRTTLCATSLVATGLFLSLAYYPKLMNQLSPKQVFVSYERLAGAQQPLGLLRLGGSAADYYAGGRGVALESVREAFAWLNQPAERRFLMIRSPDLPELNALYRRERTPARNLPVVDARSSEILLVSNQLGRGEQSRNPFDSWILDHRPRPAHPMKASLDKRLQVLGWEIRDMKGERVGAVRASVPYELVLYYEVSAPIRNEWETFVHIDGYRRRYNGDHDTLQGKYPLSLLRRGDFLADRHVIELSPNFTPGIYNLYFGLYNGSRRMHVERGDHDDNRLKAGRVEVR